MATPTLETPRLVLRSLVPEDRAPLVAVLSDARAMEHMHFRSWSVDQCQDWFDSALTDSRLLHPESLLWAIHPKASDEVIGYFGIGNPRDTINATDISFGYALARAHWNHGYMTEVLKAVFAFEFDTLGVPLLSANCRAPNLGSARVMEKAGMRYTHSDYGADLEGNLSLRHHYRITQKEWRERLV